MSEWAVGAEVGAVLLELPLDLAWLWGYISVNSSSLQTGTAAAATPPHTAGKGLPTPLAVLSVPAPEPVLG